MRSGGKAGSRIRRRLRRRSIRLRCEWVEWDECAREGAQDDWLVLYIDFVQGGGIILYILKILTLRRA